MDSEIEGRDILFLLYSKGMNCQYERVGEWHMTQKTG